MHPITYTKNHPVGVGVSFVAGMVLGPWLFNFVGGKTGVNVSFPSVGG